MPLPRLPFWREPAHRCTVLGLYRSIQRLARRLPDPLHREYVYGEARERFRYHRHETSPRVVKALLVETERASKRCR
jgi:hypothetical protein